MGNPDRPKLGEELTNRFCRTDPEIAKAFARMSTKRPAPHRSN
jgi:sigma-B regulation protein RsbQ